jgi:hypothetical protein
VCGGEGTSGSVEGELKRLRWPCMVDGLHIPIWNKARKPLAIALSGLGKRLMGEIMGKM